MSIERIEYGGWTGCIRLANAHVEAIITTAVGPRVISLSAPGGINLLKGYSEQMGGEDEAEWQIRGGHRLWVAPEDEAMTYVPDNVAVAHEIIGDNAVVLRNPPAAPWGISKELTVRLEPDAAWLTLSHRIRNEGPEPLKVAPWGLSVMAPGGIEIIPRPPLGEHPRDLLPDQLMVIWPYTDLTDPRWTLGREFITLRQDVSGKPTKLGLRHSPGWAAYALGGDLFVKRFPLEANEEYPDYGCNFETFTNGDMLEIESLGPLRNLAPGESSHYDEVWELIAGAGEPPRAIAELGAWIEPLLGRSGSPRRV